MNNNRRRGLSEKFLSSIGKIMRGMHAIFRREMEEYEVTWPQFHMLKVVTARGGIGVTELSNILMIAAPTASRMIDGLCSKGLLEKEKDPGDQRVTLIHATEKGELLMKKLAEMQIHVMEEVFEGIDDAGLEESIEHLAEIADKWFALGEQRARRSANG